VCIQPGAGEEVGCFQERRAAGVAIHLFDGRVELRRQIMDYVVTLGGHTSDELSG
jgi:hypothetical protein